MTRQDGRESQTETPSLREAAGDEAIQFLISLESWIASSPAASRNDGAAGDDLKLLHFINHFLHLNLVHLTWNVCDGAAFTRGFTNEERWCAKEF